MLQKKAFILGLAALLVVVLTLAPTAGKSGPFVAAQSPGIRYDDLPDMAEFVVDGRKWDHTNITYFFQNGTADIAGDGERQAIRDALNLWASVTILTFTEVTSAANADIVILWGEGSHGDPYPFDGLNGVLAHAFFPPPNSGSLAGDAHFDDAETWTLSTRPDSSQPMDLVTIAAHELGHSLGLGHSQVTGALMYAYYTGSHRYLAADDIAGIRTVYPRNGMTWTRIGAPPLQTDGVGCSGCNPYQGDTSCSSSLPILCVKPEGLQRPNYAVSGSPSQRGWSGGHIRLTTAAVGTSLGSLANANAICAAAFGTGYRMAEFHDGKYVTGMGADAYYGNTWPTSGLLNGGWNFYAYGNVSSASRFWTYINDQPANCWNSTSGKGMTWIKIGPPATPTDGVGCSGCNAYQGDTSCSSSLPVLCIKPEGASRENYAVLPAGGAMPDEYYRGWAGGHIGLSAAVQGASLGSLANANALCAATFGTGYRMAEFHDGKYVSGMGADAYYGSTWPTSGLLNGGWNFYAYGNVSSATRFWTYINDQTANCWD
jgi:hypothetical protein